MRVSTRVGGIAAPLGAASSPFLLLAAVLRGLWFPVPRKDPSFSAARNGRRLAPPRPEGKLLAPSSSTEEVVVLMVTYSDLFQFCIVIISIVSLVVQLTKKK